MKDAVTTKINNKLPVLFLDTITIPIAWFMAYCLRYNFSAAPSPLMKASFLYAFMVLMPMQLLSYYCFRVYRGIWRFFSIGDVLRIIKACTVSILLSLPFLHIFSLLQFLPRSILFLYPLVLISILCGIRLLRRVHYEGQRFEEESGQKRVLIIGAGQAAESLIRDLKRLAAYILVGLLDDNPAKQGLEIHGVRVLGKINMLPDLIQLATIDLVFIAIPSALSAEMRRIVAYCEESHIPFRTLPSFADLASGKVAAEALRAVNIEDLLGRDPVRLDWDKIAAFIENTKVVVTGGGGSIGSELCRQIMALKPTSLMIIDNCEYNLYKIEQELGEKYPKKDLNFVLASVTDNLAIHHHFMQFKPDIVFHAAAYKHVPMLENQVRVAIQNNVLGTEVLAKASVAVKAQKFILISTDKAVNPTNVMGATKRIAEIYCQNYNAQVQTQFITVRFGNVLGSAGSVVPLFQKQLQAGGPLTVTHPDMQRYFMTIPEASQLILQAMANGQGSEIFVLDMGMPIKINYLAEQMIRLAGKKPGEDIQIVYTGLRPGEKLFEELFHVSEQLTLTNHEKLFKAKFRELEWSELTQSMLLIHEACVNNNTKELLVLMKSLVPEFINSTVPSISEELI
jgi:FlaA1/EpsC-like NDP-sugar epimerase